MKRFLQLVLLVVITSSILVTILPLLNSQYFSMHDRQHVVRLFLLDNALKQGYWYPRWVDGLGFGFGYALFNFYPPLIYYIAEAFRLVGFSYIWSLKLMLMAGFLISFSGMYVLVSSSLKNKLVALAAAQLYLLAQYHAVLVYVRGAFAEFFGYNLLPWVFYGFYLLVKEKNIYWFAMFFALLILAHPFVAFSFVLLFIIFYLAYSLFNQKDFIVTTIRLILSSLLGLGLSAFFWLPSLFERSSTLVNTVLTKQLADYRLHFIYLRQLLNSAWGYGGSIPGPDDGLSFEIGKLHIFLICIMVGLVIWCFFKRKSFLKKLVYVVPYLLLFLISGHLREKKYSVYIDNYYYSVRTPFLWSLIQTGKVNLRK